MLRANERPVYDKEKERRISAYARLFKSGGYALDHTPRGGVRLVRVDDHDVPPAPRPQPTPPRNLWDEYFATKPGSEDARTLAQMLRMLVRDDDGR